MNKIAENALNRVFEQEKEPVRQGWKEAFENNCEDECENESEELTFDDGYDDAINEEEPQCSCGECNYCDGFESGLFDKDKEEEEEEEEEED